MSRLRTALALALRLCVIVVAVWVLHLCVERLMDWAEASAQAKMMMLGLLLAVLLAYAVLIAIPFVPGVEIGLSLLALKGGEVAPLVYLATVAGLAAAFFAGHLLSYAWLEARLRGLHLNRAAQFIADLRPLGPENRLALLQDRLPQRIAPYALGWRYLLLAVLINLPGSTMIGGGGGICMIAGFSRLFRPGAVIVTLLLAVAPAPLVFWWFDVDPSALIGHL